MIGELRIHKRSTLNNMTKQEQTLEHTKKFYDELSKQLGTNGRYKLLNNGKWLDTQESKQLTHKQFVKQLIKIARGKNG